MREANVRRSGHPQRCPECKRRILSLLRRSYGAAEVQKGFQIGASPEAFDNSPYASDIRKIYEALGDARGHKDFVKTATLRPCDYFVPQPGFVVEFDESQHFTPPRQLALSLYPHALPLGFDRDVWIEHCQQIRARDDDPVYRDEQRAWYDTLRDFLPSLLRKHPTVRLFAGERAWCALDTDSDADVQTFRRILNRER